MRKALSVLALVAATLAPMNARSAGIPVIDVTAIANLIEQVRYWQLQMTAMANQLSQLQQTYAAMTGPRGMHSLLPMTELQRNYLPGDHVELLRAATGTSTTYGALSAQIRAVIDANAILSRAQLDRLSEQERRGIEYGRRAAAIFSASTRAAYRTTSQRFALLQALISAIAASGDVKAAQDLQARIAAEQAMLQNEQTKLQAMYQMVQAEHWVEQQRQRERSVSDVGSVTTLERVRY